MKVAALNCSTPETATTGCTTRSGTAARIGDPDLSVRQSQGWDMKVVAQLLGHASVTTTSRYLDELPGELSVAVNAHP